MPEIFISYRRVDTEESGSHLYDNLSQVFGENSVFMDIKPRGIPWGADNEKATGQALEECEACVVLIGPRWLTCTRDGRRRLDAPDDWVRREIVAALGSSKQVFPVLLKGASPPEEKDIPEELRLLRFHCIQAHPVSETRWEQDTQLLFEKLTLIPKL